LANETDVLHYAFVVPFLQTTPRFPHVAAMRNAMS
jgi:hypothetical protein